MIEKRIEFKEDGRMYLGRNGIGYCQGVELWKFSKEDKTISIQPINSKGDTARCHIEIPSAKIPELIKLLEEFL